MKNCVYCNNDKIVKAGFDINNFQRYLCRNCKKRFTEKTNPNVGLILNNEKYCSVCDKFKPLSKFPKWNNIISYRCKSCKSKASKSRYLNHNLTEIEFNIMVNNQNNRCSICNSEFKSNRHTFIDHNHINGKVRELLCPKCNGILGYCNDNILILENAIKYIVKHNK